MMSTKNKLLVLVQNRPTQFDVPLYAKAQVHSSIDIRVFYTKYSPTDIHTIDEETSIAPQWDHLNGLEYPACFMKGTFTIWKQIVSLKPDHVIIGGWYPRVHALLALLLRMKGISVGVRSDNTLLHNNLSGVRWFTKRILISMWLCLYNTWHPVGSLAKSYFEELSFRKRPSYFFPYTVDTEWFESNAALYRANRITLREKIGLCSSDFVVLGVMKWSEREDPLTLVRALINASTKLPHIKLILLGDGPLRNRVKKLMEAAPKIFVTPGYVKYSDLPKYYAISDLFVHPAFSEPYGVSVQEALACGLPVIASDKVGSAIDFIKPGVTGDIYPVGNIDELKCKLLTYAERPYDENATLEAQKMANEWSYANTINEWQRCLGII